MILTDREIQIALNNRHIIIEPSPKVEAYSSTSVDLTLDPHITLFRDDLRDSPIETVIDPSHPSFVAERILAQITQSETIDKKNGFLLQPRKLILGWTIERVELPIQSKLAARVEGKSSLARLGLGVHITAPTIHSGFANPIRLEIINHGEVPIRLRINMPNLSIDIRNYIRDPSKGFPAATVGPDARSAVGEVIVGKAFAVQNSSNGGLPPGRSHGGEGDCQRIAAQHHKGD